MSVRAVDNNNLVGRTSTVAVGGAAIGALGGYLGQKYLLKKPKFVNDFFIRQLHELNQLVPKSESMAIAIAKDKHTIRGMYKSFRDYVAAGKVSALSNYRLAAITAGVAAVGYLAYKGIKKLFTPKYVILKND